MFDKTMLENYELQVKEGNIPSDLLDKLLKPMVGDARHSEGNR